MGRVSRRITVASAALAVLGALVLLTLPSPAAPSGATRGAKAAAAKAAVSLEWLGWSHFRLTSPAGKVVLLNPFVANPDSPVKVEDIKRADLIFAADGHLDEIGSTVQIAKQTGAGVFAPAELLSWFIEQGVPESQVPVRFANPGDRLRLGAVTLRMVNSIHGSGLPAPTAQNPYGGPASGVFITFENGWTVYFAGSTAATRDQAMWAQMYKPDLAILPLNGSRDPMDFAMQVKQLKIGNPNLRTVIAHHLRVTPQPGQTTVTEARAAVRNLGLRGVRVVKPALSRVVRFTK
jgi:L-ascorbate metabolism protein UlaG (beta-lactamase superfamily)